MATETRSRFNKTIVPGLFAYASEQFKRYPKTWQEFYTMRTSKRAYEESTYASGFGYLIQKPEGTAFTTDARIQGPTKKWVHDTWALACRITEEAIEDDLYGIMKQAMKDLMVSVAATRHLLAMRMFMNGTATTYHTAGDGYAVFYDSHTKLGGGTWDNLGSAADPTVASLTSAIYNFERITDHRGKKYDQKADFVACGPSLEFAMDKLLNSDGEPDTAFTNNRNSVVKRRKLRLVVDAEITDDRWFVGGPKDEEVGFIWFDRVKPTTGRYGDDDTGDAIFTVRGRWSNEVNDPRSMYMVPDFS